MNSGSIILQTKLTPPQVKRNTLRRSSLAKKMKRIVDHPLMIIYSGPGYGKSMALSSFLKTEKTLSFWYSLDSQDDDLVPFLMHLIYSIRNRFPKFGEEMLHQLAGGKRYDENEVHFLCRLFINEIMQLPEDAILVLDDFHSVEHSELINHWMMFLLEHQPEKLHLIVSSRQRPAWEVLLKIKAKGDLIEITEKDLAFTEEEIEVLFTDLFEHPLSAEQVKAVHHMTEGWIIAIQMIWQQLNAVGDLTSIFHNHANSMEDLFQFLALEVLNKQKESIRRLLLQTSIFNVFSASLCEEVFAIEDAHELLEQISNQRLFISYVGESQYRYHALFRDFLLKELQKTPDLHRHLHAAAAKHFREKDDASRAIHHLSAIKDYAGLAEVAQSHGGLLIQNGQLETLLSVIVQIPEWLKNRYYKLWIYEGEIYRYRCLYEKAAACYETGGALAKEAHDSLGLIRALEGQASIFLDTLQPGKAEAPLSQALMLYKEIEPHLIQRDEDYQFHLYYLMAENLLNSARLKEAMDWYEHLSEWNPDDNLKVRLHLRTGHLLQARKILFQRKNDSDKLRRLHSEAHRYTDHYISLIDAFIGLPEESKAYAETGMMQGVTSNAPYVEALGWMRMGHAAQLLPKYDFSVAYDCYMASLDIMDSIQLARGRAEPMMGLCLLYGRNKLWEQAIMYGETGIAETEKVNDKWVSTLIRLSMGIASVYGLRYKEAERYLIQSMQDFDSCGDSYGLTVAYMWLSLMAYQLGDRERLASCLDLFFKKMQAGAYEFLLQRQTFFGPRDVQQLSPLLFEALHSSIQTSYVKELINKLGMGHTDYHPGYTLRIQTLGSFRVWLGDKEIEERDWQRGKVKELFQFLLMNRNRMVSREEIYESLWKSASEKTVLRDFKVALSVLNSTLEPDRKGKSSPFFIARNGTSYGLNLTSGLQLDALEFERFVREGLETKQSDKAKTKLKQGLDYYHGDFLHERVDEDWCIAERERLQVLFLHGAERLAKLCLQDKEYDKSIYWCEQILRKDACWEEAYRLLMCCHLENNNRNQALKWYQKCVKTLDTELGISPMPATSHIYKTILETGATELQP